MNLLGTITFTSGALLIYCAVKDKTPAQVIKEIMDQGTGKPAAPTTVAPGDTRRNLIPPAQRLATN